MSRQLDFLQLKIQSDFNLMGNIRLKVLLCHYKKKFWISHTILKRKTAKNNNTKPKPSPIQYQYGCLKNGWPLWNSKHCFNFSTKNFTELFNYSNILHLMARASNPNLYCDSFSKMCLVKGNTVQSIEIAKCWCSIVNFTQPNGYLLFKTFIT